MVEDAVTMPILAKYTDTEYKELANVLHQLLVLRVCVLGQNRHGNCILHHVQSGDEDLGILLFCFYSQQLPLRLAVLFAAWWVPAAIVTGRSYPSLIHHVKIKSPELGLVLGHPDWYGL